jgi:fibronectin-binding autotransporter adhesin
MRMNSWNPIHFAITCCVIVFAIVVNSTNLQAQNGTWISTVDALWSAPGSWAGGTIANGANNTANFNTLDIQDQTGATGFPAVGVQLDSPRTIGHMIFGDTNAATPGAWDLFTLDQVNNLLTLADATKPSITVNPLGPVGAPPAQDAARVLVSLVGTNGFTKLGAGTLQLQGPNPNLTGNIDVNAGKLRVAAGTTFDFETAVTPAVTRFNLANGSEIETAVSLGQNAAGGAGITLASGSTATITNTAPGSVFFANVSGAGATLNFNMTTGGVLGTSVDRDWAAAGALAAVNFKGLAVGSPSQVRLRNNGGTFNFNSFGSTAVNLDNTLLFTNTNSGGNTNNFGSLSGTSTSTLQGGAAGSVITYVIGGLNTNTNFAGAVTTGNGINLFKVGTGTLELSGNLSYAPTNNAILNRRGGVTRIEAGTLKLTGPAAIPGGSVDVTQGDLISTIDIRAGATLDVAGTTTPYSTAPLQQVIGTGTIAGNYNHDQGTLAPGDTNVGGNTQTLTSVAGTLTFANNLSFVGSGAIAFNLGTTPAGSNDLIQVNGVANLSGTPSITPSFASGIPTAGQTFTLLNATGGFGGSNPSGWVVNWPGRNPVGPSVFTSGNKVQITTTPVVTHSLNWSGAVDGNWNTTTANWFDNTASAAGNYVELDNVTFADTANGVPVTTSTVNLPGAVNPSTVTVDSTINYTIAGTGRIAGNATLIKRGTGTLNLTGANTFVGGATIEAGIIDLGPAGQIGSGTVTLAGGRLHAGDAANFTLPNAIQVNGSGNVISNDNNGSQTLNLNGNISGTGSLALQNNSIGNGVDPPVINGVDLFGNNTGFSGSITVGGPTAVFARLRTDGSEGANAAWDLGNNGSVLAANVGANTVFQIGSLTGGTLSRVSGHESSGGVGSSTYEVGALGTSTTFSGAIMDGRTDLNVGNFTALTKVGSGTLTLDNMVDPNLADTITLYSGDTRIKGGTLSIAQAFLADTSDVHIGAGSVFNLNTLGATDVIDSLYLGSTPQNPGTYGAVGSGATFQSAFFSGTGILSVTTLGAPITTQGDFDNDGDVDGRDFLIWQRGGSPNGATAGDLAQWQANYGTTPLTAAVTASSTAVPEPGTMGLVTLAVLLGSSIRRRK